MSHTHEAVLLALCAALASAIGNVIRQRSAQEVTDKPVGHLALFGMLLRDTRWWMGGLGDIASYCLLAWALDEGSVLLVMSLQVTALLFALPIYARVTRHPVTRGEWLWAVLLAAALALVIAVGQPAGGQEHGSLGAWLVVAIVIGPPLLLCLLGARIWSDRPAAALLLAAVAGSLLAVFSVLMKGVVDVIEHSAGQLWHTPEAVCLGVRRRGRDDLSSVGLSRRCADRLPADDYRRKAGRGGGTRSHRARRNFARRRPEWFVLAVAAVVVIVATVGLARGEAATMAAGAGRDVKITDQPKAASQA